MSASSYLVVDAELGAPPYVQVKEQVRAAIERGELVPGATLPTVRQLAGDLGIAPNTVARAYADLQQEGWLVSDGRRGTRVAGELPQLDRRGRTRTLRQSLERFVDALVHRGYTRGEIAVEIARFL
ncbi:MAG TPA: GntR family transcriptional regulator [Candidatus Tumulicola sp.]|jgi:DNA-binding transcriptional regulator YhcF (GntR family)